MRLIQRLRIARLACLAGLCRRWRREPRPRRRAIRSATNSIETIRQSWSVPGARPQPNAAGWDALFDALLNDLKRLRQSDIRSRSTGSARAIQQISSELAAFHGRPPRHCVKRSGSGFAPVSSGRGDSASSRHGRGHAAQLRPDVQANRSRWVDFAENELGNALRDYDARPDGSHTAVAALRQIHASLDILDRLNQNRPWWPSRELESAVNDLFNQPNLDVSADVSHRLALLQCQPGGTGPVYRKGYWSQVTAGPKTGFGLAAQRRRHRVL